MRYFDIEYSSYVTVTREADPEVKWDANDTSVEWDVSGNIREINEDKYGSIPWGEDVDPEYLLYYVYSTGDSFGRAYGGSIEFIGLYTNYEYAKKSADIIRSHDNKYEYSVNILDNNGKEIKIHAAWSGYFESLCYVEVIPVNIENRRRYRT